MIEGIWLYITAGLVIILAILSIALVIKKKGEATAKKKVLDAFKEKGYIVEEEKEDKRIQERKVIDELLFFVGAIALVAGYLKNNYYVLISGLVVMFISLFLLRSLLKRKPKETKKEKAIVKKVDHILKKEAILKKKEKELQRQIDDLYKIARALRGKELKLDKKEEKIKKKELNLEKPAIIIEKDVDKDLKRVLKIADNLLEKLPEEEIQKFAKTEDFELYKKVMKDIK